MNRKEIADRFKHVKKCSMVNPKEGECYEMPGNSIEKQIRHCKEGERNIIFFLKVKKVVLDGDMPNIDISLEGENVYLTPTKYV